MNKKQIIKGLKAVKQKCKENDCCEHCELECYCQHRRVYGTPQLFPKFNNRLVMYEFKGDMLVLVDLDNLFNALSKVCCNTVYCDDCPINRLCEKTCGFGEAPEAWKL